MDNNLFFESGKNSVFEFIDKEYPNFPQKLTAQIINFCSNLAFY